MKQENQGDHRRRFENASLPAWLSKTLPPQRENGVHKGGACVQASWKHGWATDSWKNLCQCSRLVIDLTHSATIPLIVFVVIFVFRRHTCFCTMLLHTDNPRRWSERQIDSSRERINKYTCFSYIFLHIN